MFKLLDIPEKLHYVLERGDFESRRSVSSIAFMLDKHISDPEWLESEEFNALMDKAVESLLYAYIYNTGTLGVLLGENSVPEHYSYNKERTYVCYIQEH